MFRMLKHKEKVLKLHSNNYFKLSRLLAGKAFLLMKSKLFLFISAFVSFLFFNNSMFHIQSVVQEQSVDSLTISVVGDLMCHSPQFEYARTGKDNFNFDISFYYVKPFIVKADIALANFETVLAGKEKKYSGYPTFNTPDAFLKSVKNAGFDFLFTSNNHSFDRGKEGILKTLSKIKNEGLKSTGTFSSKRERDSVKIVDVKGFKIVFLSYTEHLNGFKKPLGSEFIVNLIDTNQIKHDLREAKKHKIDLAVVYFHFGEEYKRQPVKYQKEIVKKAVSYGADIILASHPHVIEKLETFKPVNSKLDTGFVAYSLGNFLSNQRWRYSDAGVILNFTIEKNVRGALLLKNIEIVPTWVFKGLLFVKDEYAILPSEEAFLPKPLFFLNSTYIKQMKESYFDTQEIMLKGLKLSGSKITSKKFSAR